MNVKIEETMTRLSCIVAVFGIAFSVCVLTEELYSDRYDNIDIQSILQNDKLRDQYYNCYMEKAPCVTEDAKFFQGIFSESYQTKCKKCTQRQKEMMKILSKWFTQNRPKQWEALIAKSVEDMKKKNAGR